MLEYSSRRFQEKFHFASVEPVPDSQKTANRDDRSQRLEIIRIPVLAPTLDRGLREDRSLCPIRAIKINRDKKDNLMGS